MWKRMCVGMGRMLGQAEPECGRLLAWCALLAFVLGGARAVLHRTEKTTWAQVLMAAIASAGAGVITALLILHAWGVESRYLIGAAAGLAGWLGTTLLDWAGEKAMALIQKKVGEEEEVNR